MNRFLSIFTLLILSLCPAITQAQEDLSTILERGFPAQWFVCGPFDSDLDQGIIEAVGNNQNPLGRNDFMTSIGGIRTARPAHGLEVAKDNGVATWLRTRATDSTVDMAPFFKDIDSGIAFAAFYANSLSEQTVLFDLQSPLGARVFLNGKEIREVNTAPLSLAGVDQFEATFQPGGNLLILEIPGARIEALALRFNQSTEVFRQNQFQNKPNLPIKTGFEFRLTMKSMSGFAGIHYAPTLESTGTFSGQQNNLFQDAWLTFYNPTDTPSPELSYTATAEGASTRIKKTIPSIPPNAAHRERIPIPVASRTPGQPIRISSALTLNRVDKNWISSLTAAPKPAPAQIHAVSTPSFLNAANTPQSDIVEQYRAELNTNILRNRENPEYGFSFGTADHWFPILSAYPEYRHPLAPMLKNQSVAPWNTYTQLDERIVNGEAIIRNLWLGKAFNEEILRVSQKVYWAWNTPAIAPQTPQILKDAKVSGIIHNLPYAGLPSLYDQLAPDGSRILTRRKTNSPALKSILNLHQTAQRQHRYWENKGLISDLLIRENTARAPESFWMDNSLPLSKAYPPIQVIGGGGDQYFDNLQKERPFIMSQRPVISRNTTHHSPWSLLLHPELQQLYTRQQQQLHAAEMFATFDAFNGTLYPFAALNDAWKTILYLSHPQRTSDPQAQNNYIDQLAVHRDLKAATTSILHDALQGIAETVNTDTAKAPQTPGTQALLVFNPTSQIRTDLVKTTLKLDNIEGLTLFDPQGKSVPFIASNLLIEDRRLIQADIQFLAESVPPVGYTTYHYAPRGALQQPRELFTPYIENEFFQIHLSNGEISKIIDRTGLLPEINNAVFNDIVAYHLVPDQKEALWNNDITRASDQKSEITYETTPLGQRVIIQTPFAGGQLTRTITLYNGIPWINLDLETTDITQNNIALGAAFAPVSNALAPINGHQYGSIFGRKALPAAQLRDSEDAPRPPFTANTSLGFHGLAVPPHIKVEGSDIVFPIEPAMMIHSGSSTQDNAVKEIQTALIQKGIPTSAYAQNALDSRSIWPDDTMFTDFNDDLAIGTFFRVLIGHPDENPMVANLIAQFSDATQQQVSDHIERSLPLFAFDNNVPFGHEPVPTLILAGRNISTTLTLIKEVARQIREEGSITLSPDQYLPAEGSKKPAWGVALFHTGVAASRVEGNTWTHFFKVNKNTGDPATANAPTSYIVNYALYPFSGNMAAGNVPQLANRYSTKLITTQTNVHAGTIPAASSFLSTPSTHFIVTSVHPKIPEASIIMEQDTLIEAVIVRGYETKGYGGEVNLNFAPTTYGMAAVNPFDEEQEAIRTVTSNIQFQTKPNDINAIALHTAPPGKRRTKKEEGNHDHLMATRSWRQNAGPAHGMDHALTVRINTPIPTPEGPVLITVSNNSPYNAYAGQLTTTVAQGWSVSPATQNFNLAPNKFATFNVIVSRENPELMQWAMIAQIDRDDSSVFDVAANFDYPIDVTSDHLKNEYMIIIRNRGGLPLIGSAELITDLDTVFGETSITPIDATFHVQPYQVKRIVYRNSGARVPTWMFAKVTANNKMWYHPVDLTKNK